MVTPSTGLSRSTTTWWHARGSSTIATTQCADGATVTSRRPQGGGCADGKPTSSSSRRHRLRLPGSGEDQGRLVEVFDDGRTALLAEVLERARPDAAARVHHAVALFRRRGATDEDKRSALITLAGILEERRQLIKAELVSADKGALFQIANKFAIRHQNSQQLGDYDPAFLDWVFWWYLATVELTNRIITRQEGKSAEHGLRDTDGRSQRQESA